MATVKRMTDLGQYAGVLPYASEMFGIYQPLLGWKSKRTAERIERALARDRAQVIASLRREITPDVTIEYDEAGQAHIDISSGRLRTGAKRVVDSIVLERISQSLPPHEDYDPKVWSNVIEPQALDTILKKDVVAAYTEGLAQLREKHSSRKETSTELETTTFEKYLNYESQLAGVLLLLAERARHDVLEELFYVVSDSGERARSLGRLLSDEDPTSALLDLNSLDPTDAEQLKGVSLSPISVVHLFRQYFFELDTFLGTSERHVWLSPGSTVELFEVHTRRTTTERTVETTLDILSKTESTAVSQEELSEAVRDENSQDIKAGASVTATYTGVSATASFDYASSQKEAREKTHKRNREQADKLSSEIRKNFKTTFKTTTEVTETSSTRHLLANSTDSLINYELRRKMRQVGVQLQDVGTYLCWQTYVDDPGASLGLAKLVHIAKPAELDSIPHPEELPSLQPFQEETLITIPFISVDGTGADNEGEVYVNGVESEQTEWNGSEERIQYRFRQEAICPRVDYELADISVDAQGKPVRVSRVGGIDNTALPKASFTLNLDSADFQGQNSLQVKLLLHWAPLTSANQEIEAKNKALQNQFSAAEKQAFEKAAVETLKERVDMVSRLAARSSDDLREEERIVIYRKLVQEMLQKNVPMPDDQTRHVVAELINSIFDVDKMLYFVSPEWWRPRERRSAQQLNTIPEGGGGRGPRVPGLGGAEVALSVGLYPAVARAVTNSAATLAHSSTVGWGGIDDASRDSYYVTSDSEPARMGSSLGWLLQLDGDNMRNAFLNAPWVKAVMPIRPGKEKAAINWLKGVEGMNGITDDVLYAGGPNEVDVNGDPLNGQPLIDVLFDLAEKIRRKHEESVEMDEFPKASEVIDPVLADPGNTVTATPVDRVYEHGFFPLNGSFRANVGANYEIFDQWTEVLPTDQIVPVEVAYDPKTGRQT